MKDLLANNSYKRLAFYNKGFINTSEEDWFDYKQDYINHAHLLEDKFVDSNSVRVSITDEYTIELPTELNDIANEINKAVEFLDNIEDWDPDEGEVYTYSTLKNASTFLADYSIWVLNEQGFVIPTPKIYPGPNGTIDILWKDEKFKLLVNVRPHPDLSATFYGKTNDGEEFVEGKFKIGNINQNVFLVLLEQYK
ncbi:MAG: hypothetical protein WD607_11530 [Candidatus Paceibacterota bacterium]